jgi:hypothetical protein
MKAIDKQIANILTDFLTHGEATLTANQLKELFKYEELADIETRRKEFADTLRPYVDTYGSDMIKAFYTYWAAGKIKMAWEKEKSWHLPQRLSTWERNNRKFQITNMIRTKGLTL